MKKDSEKGLTPIFVIAIVLAILVISAFFIKNYFLANNENTKEITGEEGTEEEAFLKNLKDCKDSLKCLADAAKDCTPAKVNYKITVNIFGATQTTESIFAITGKENEKCIFYLKYKKIDLTFPPETPEENIEQAKAMYKALEGRDGICKFEPEKLNELLERWNMGKFSTNDFKEGECEGKYFEAPSEEEYRGKRIPANTKDIIENCPGEIIPIENDNTACFEDQKDIGTVRGVKIGGKPVQCCVKK